MIEVLRSYCTPKLATLGHMTLCAPPASIFTRAHAPLRVRLLNQKVEQRDVVVPTIERLLNVKLEALKGVAIRRQLEASELVTEVQLAVQAHEVLVEVYTACTQRPFE